MKVLLENISLTNLSKKAHNRLIQKSSTKAEANETILRELPNTLSELHLAAVKEADSMLHLSRSLYTPEIKKADEAMDAAIRHFKAGLRFYMECEDPERQRAAEHLWYLIKDSSVSEQGTMSSQLGIIPEFISQCEGVLTGYIRMLEMQPELTRLKTATDTLNQLLSDRNEELSITQTGKNVKAREDSDIAWRNFRVAFNGLILEKGDEGVANFAAEMNEEIRYLKRWDLHESTTAPEEVPDSTPSSPEPSEPTTPPTSEPTDPTTPGETEPTDPTTPPSTEPGEPTEPKKRTVTLHDYDGNVLQTLEMEVGKPLVLPDPPRGFEWGNVPAVMPDRDLNIYPIDPETGE